MTSKSDSIGSGGDLNPHHVPSNNGTLSTAGGEREAKPLSTTSKCAIIAFVIGGVAGIVIIGLGAVNMFGPVGSSGFIGSVAGGGAATVLSGGGLIWIAIANCKTGQGEPETSTGTRNGANAVESDASADGLRAPAQKTGQGGFGGSSLLTKTRSGTNAVEPGSSIDGLRAPAKDKMGKAYPQIGQEAIVFARQKLSEHPDIKPAVFSAGWNGPDETNQPINQEIALLINLYWDVSFKALEEATKAHGDNPWAHQNVIQAADELIKIGYAITCLTLEDLPEFTQALESKGTKRTYAKALTTQDSYQYRTYYSCTRAYHWVRGAATWVEDKYDEENGGYLGHPKKASKAHADLFYQEGTIQCGWRQLYNDHCDRIRSYVKESDLQQADNRHFTWTQKDEDTFFKGRTFSDGPDSLPT